jgi:tetratricopeptide (TPR) repeat protein
LKRLSHQLQPYQEVIQIIEGIAEEIREKNKLEMRVFKHLISYALYQLGDRVVEKKYRERENGERINNWNAEVLILLPIYNDILNCYFKDKSLSLASRDDLVIPYYEKMLDLLRPWSKYFDLNYTSGMDNLDREQINHLLRLSSQVECQVGESYRHQNKFDLSENHCQLGISYARLYEGNKEDKVHLLGTALTKLHDLRLIQENFEDALCFAEEAYDIVAIAYNPVHSRVQEAASTLIKCLLAKGDLDKAKVYASMTLDSLKDPANGMDQESETVAGGRDNLARVFLKEDNHAKAEMLVRESLRIRTLLYDVNHPILGKNIGLLGSIFLSQKRINSETKELLERSLAIDKWHYGPEGLNTALSYVKMGIFYQELNIQSTTVEKKKDTFLQAKSNFEEGLRIYTIVHGSNSSNAIGLSQILSNF